MKLAWIIAYFFIGGALMSGMMYFGFQGKGHWSALLALMPLWTLLPLVTLYYHSGIESVLGYAQGLILLTIPWLLSASCIIWLVPYLSIYTTWSIGFIIYIGCAFIINWLQKL